jgi:NADH-quinone oxidoreductase subunit A
MLRLGIYALAIGIMVAVMLGASWALGPRRGAADRNHRGAADSIPFESGILPLHDTSIRFPSQFYLVAMLFVIFDLEMVFVFAWAVAVRPAGWPGYAGMLAFLTLLLLALAYLWRSGALEWGPRRNIPTLEYRLRRQ